MIHDRLKRRTVKKRTIKKKSVKKGKVFNRRDKTNPQDRRKIFAVSTQLKQLRKEILKKIQA